MSDMETRLQIVERDVAEFRQLLPLIHSMDKKLDIIALRKECPSPGLCLALEPRVRCLEDERNRAVGGFKTLVFVGTFVGSVVGWFLGMWTGKH
jgi:hypothetical protein